jgi:hypothetical protein
MYSNSKLYISGNIYILKLYSMVHKLALILVKWFVITKRTSLFLMVTVNVLDSIPVIATNIKCVIKGL